MAAPREPALQQPLFRDFALEAVAAHAATTSTEAPAWGSKHSLPPFPQSSRMPPRVPQFQVMPLMTVI